MDLLSNGKLGMGTWFLGEHKGMYQSELETIRYGLEKGIKLIDTAEMYGEGLAEKLVGEAISPYERESIYLVSKVLPQNANAKQLEKSLDGSLQRLKTDYLDLYLYHWRGNTPLEETIYYLELMKDKGKIKEWGVSNFDLEDMLDLETIPDGHRCMVNQVLYHLGSRGIEVAIKPYQDKRNIVTMAYCPMAQAGRLSKNLIQHPILKRISSDYNISIYQLLLSFTLEQSNMISIPRTGNLSHMKDNLNCLNIKLKQETLIELNRIFPVPAERVPLDTE